MASSFDGVVAGALGFWWNVPPSADAEPLRGYGRVRDGYYDIELLVEDVEAARDSRRLPLPEGMSAALTEASILATDILHRGHRTNYFGSRASVETYRAETVLMDVGDPDRFTTAGLRHASMRVPNALMWAGLEAEEVALGQDENGLVRDLSLQLTIPPAPSAARISAGLSLVFNTHWRTSKDSEQRLLNTALEVGVRSAITRPATDLVQVLDRVRWLLALAYRGWVIGSPGRVDPPVMRRSDRGPETVFWNGRLMTNTTGAREADMSKPPVFTLADMGGPRGVARWVRLTQQHPRAVAPLILPLRTGGRAPEEYLLAVATAMEYWVAVNAGGWAGRGLKGPRKVRALVDHVGPRWTRFVGDPQTWSQLLWNDYTDLKHDPTAALDQKRLHLLATSGRLLLECAVLNAAAGSKKPSTALLTHGNLYFTQTELQALTAGTASTSSAQPGVT